MEVISPSSVSFAVAPESLNISQAFRVIFPDPISVRVGGFPRPMVIVAALEAQCVGYFFSQILYSILYFPDAIVVLQVSIPLSEREKSFGRFFAETVIVVVSIAFQASVSLLIRDNFPGYHTIPVAVSAFAKSGAFVTITVRVTILLLLPAVSIFQYASV